MSRPPAPDRDPPAGEPRAAERRPITIGVDAACWAQARGYGRFARGILRAMAASAGGDRLVLFADPETAEAIDLEGPAARVVPVRLRQRPIEAATAAKRRAALDLGRLARAVKREPLDAFFFPSLYTWFPLPRGLPSVVTIHDAIPERHPDDTFGSWQARFLWWTKSWCARRQSETILTVSDFSAREIAEVLGVDPARIRVAGEAPEPDWRPADAADVAAVAAGLGLPEGARWFAYVGGFDAHKRVDSLVRAHAGIVRDAAGDPPFLVLIGAERDAFHGDVDTVRRAIEACGTEPAVRWTGRVSDAELRALLTGALALVLPSKTEGFGLPAVEAAACGTPVVATTRSPLPELLEGGGRFVDPGDPGALAAALREIVADEGGRRAMGTVARERAAALSWADAADRTLAAIREVAR